MVKFKLNYNSFNAIDSLVSCAKKGYDELFYTSRWEISPTGKCKLFLTDTTHRVQRTIMVEEVEGISETGFIMAINAVKLKEVLSSLTSDAYFEIDGEHIKVKSGSKVLYFFSLSSSLAEDYLFTDIEIGSKYQVPVKEFTKLLTFFDYAVRISGTGVRNIVFKNNGFAYLTDRILFFSYKIDPIPESFILPSVDTSLLLKYLKSLPNDVEDLTVGLSTEGRDIFVYDNSLDTYISIPRDNRNDYRNVAREKKAEVDTLVYRSKIDVTSLKNTSSLLGVVRDENEYSFKITVNRESLNFSVTSIGNKISREAVPAVPEVFNYDGNDFTIFFSIDLFKKIINKFSSDVFISFYKFDNEVRNQGMYYLLLEDENVRSLIFVASLRPVNRG